MKTTTKVALLALVATLLAIACVEASRSQLGGPSRRSADTQTIRSTTEHPYWVIDRGWTAAVDLRVGDRLLGADGEELTVVGHDVRQEEADHFNFEVEDWHTYFVAGREDAPAVWVHNTCFPEKQLQKKFKHAEDFGVKGNYNKANAEKFRDALQTHVDAPGTQKISGTYRGKDAIHHVDPHTGLNVITALDGTFVSGWKLSSQQLNHVLNGGKLGGG